VIFDPSRAHYFILLFTSFIEGWLRIPLKKSGSFIEVFGNGLTTDFPKYSMIYNQFSV